MKDLAQTVISENVYLIEYIKVIWNSKKTNENSKKKLKKSINHRISSSEVTNVKYVHILLGII